MGYQVLSRPEGTEAFKRGTLSILADSLSGGLKEGLERGRQTSKDKEIREAIKREGMKPKYKKTKDGTWTEEWQAPDDMKEFEKNIKRKVADPDTYGQLTKEEKDFYEHFMVSATMRPLTLDFPVEEVPGVLKEEAAPKPPNKVTNFFRNLLGGGQEDNTLGTVSTFKVGDTRVIDGVTYKRNETGQWLPQ